MPAGFYVVNDAGTILIDDTNPSLAMRQKTLVTSVAAEYPNTAFGPNADFPAIAIASAAFAYLNSTAWAGTTITYGTRCEFGTPDGSPATLYVYDRPIAGVNSGLRILDATGKITFDAMGKYGRVASIRTANGTYTGAAGRSYAGTILSSIFKDEIILDPVIVGNRIRRIWKTGVKAVGNTLVVADMIESQISYASSETPVVLQNRGTPRVLVTDVTGY